MPGHTALHGYKNLNLREQSLRFYIERFDILSNVPLPNFLHLKFLTVCQSTFYQLWDCLTVGQLVFEHIAGLVYIMSRIVMLWRYGIVLSEGPGDVWFKCAGK